MDYLSPHDQSHLARTCRALHTATLSHRCSSSLITLSPSDRIISSFLAFLRLNANPSDPGNSRAPLIHKLSIATPTFPPVVDWHAFPEARTLGYRATYPAISDAVLAILTACTNLSTFRLDVWSGRLPADRLCTSIATLRGLEELQLTVTHARLWGETTALARLPKLRRLVLSLESPTANQTSEIVLESTPTPFALAATISPQTLTSLRLQLSYDSSATSIADACLPNVRILHLTLVQTDQVQPTPRHALPTPTLARAFPNLTHLTFGVRGWVGLDEHIAGQWRDANRAETSAAWPHLAVLCGLDVPDLWLLGLAHRVLHVCVGEADGLLGVHWPGEHFPEGPNGAAWAAGWVRRMVPAVLEDARPTHLELAATAPRTVFVGRNRNRREVNVVETLSVLGECVAGGKGAVGASITHLLVNVPAPELMEKKILVSSGLHFRCTGFVDRASVVMCRVECAPLYRAYCAHISTFVSPPI